jgi:hypothetical protein
MAHPPAAVKTGGSNRRPPTGMMVRGDRAALSEYDALRGGRFVDVSFDDLTCISHAPDKTGN